MSDASTSSSLSAPTFVCLSPFIIWPSASFFDYVRKLFDLFSVLFIQRSPKGAGCWRLDTFLSSFTCCRSAFVSWTDDGNTIRCISRSTERRRKVTFLVERVTQFNRPLRPLVALLLITDRSSLTYFPGLSMATSSGKKVSLDVRCVLHLAVKWRGVPAAISKLKRGQLSALK
jgi:hypothetical protein